MITKYWNIARFWGANDQMKILEQKRIILLNEISIFLTLNVLVIYMPIALMDIERIFSNFLLVMLAALISFTPLIFNYFDKINTARWVFSLSNIIGVTLFIMLSGEVLRLDISWILQMALVVIFFRNNINRSILFLTSIIGFFLSKYYLSFNQLIYEPADYTGFHVFTFIYILASIVIIIGRYISTTTNIEQQRQNSLLSLRQKQSQLLKNRTLIESHNDELAHANKELEQFAYVASHDLKSPIRNISSFLTLIKRKLKDHEDKSIHEYIEFATDSTAQMNHLIQDILDYSRINNLDKGDSEIINLNHVISGVEENLGHLIQKQNALIVKEELPHIKCNPEYIYLLFENIMKNGLLYNESHIPALKIKGERKAKYFEIHILDNGIGVAKEHQEQIFEMFKRLHTQVKYKGSGIGLAVSKKIIELMEGNISIESEEHQGSTFIIRLPLHIIK